jgi:hypothetical protein
MGMGNVTAEEGGFGRRGGAALGVHLYDVY